MPKDANNAEKCEQSTCHGWTTVTNKTKMSKANTQDPPNGQINVLANNKYFVPVKVDCAKKKDQYSKKSAEDFNSHRQSNTERTKKQLRCFKRNQRRARKRQQKREGIAKLTTPSEEKRRRCSFSKKFDESTGTQEKIIVHNIGHTLFALPQEVLVSGILPFLNTENLAKLGLCSKYSMKISGEGILWMSAFKRRFPERHLSPISSQEWKLAYKLSATQTIDHLRCFHSKKTFFEDILGAGIDFTINPKTKCVDYINIGQDLLSEHAFKHGNIRSDVFGNTFKLFLPLYFSEDHFERALPSVKKTIVRLCPDKKLSRFDPIMVLDVFPKVINTFVVLLSDEGVSASRRSFNGLIRTHQLFLALAHRYPVIKQEARKRLHAFVMKEKSRIKTACPSLGNMIPLLFIVDQHDISWEKVAPTFLGECFDRSVLWICKKFPQLERTHSQSGEIESAADAEKRVELTLEAMTVNLRLVMFHASFLQACCQSTTTARERLYNRFFPLLEPEAMPAFPNKVGKSSEGSCALKKVHAQLDILDIPLGLRFSHFRAQVLYILSVKTWQHFFQFIRVRCPRTKTEMADRLRQHVKNSRRKGYHKTGMDFSRVHASGTSRILSKGQQYGLSSMLQQVVFTDVWGFSGRTKYLDATCLLYRGKNRAYTVDYRHTEVGGVRHSGDLLREDGGTHTIHIDLRELQLSGVTSCIFVISAWADATLSDIHSPSIALTDADSEPDSDPLCTYDLDAHDKISHLTSVVMCKLYRPRKGDGWHILAIGDAYRGAADDYSPIYEAAQQYLE